MFLKRLNISSRFMLVLAIGFAFQASISVVSLYDMRAAMLQDRTAEVKHLLESAYSTVAYYHRRAVEGAMTDAEARRAAADAVRAMHYDGANYFFIWDLNGLSVAHGAQPALEGRTFLNSPDAERNPVVAYMVRQLVDVAKSEQREGLTSYRIPKAGQTEPLDKIAYSRLFEPWGWSIGTGAYVDDIEDAFRARAISVLWRMLALILVASAMTYAIGRDLAQALKRLSDRVTRVARGELDCEVADVDRRDEVGEMARALLVLRDTSREAGELRLDQLTGLPTRKLLMDRLQQAKASAARGGDPGAVMLVDLDKFKEVNDTHGHDVGDMLLREVAQRLAGCVRAGDTVARLGGDEFVIVLRDIGRADTQAAIAAETVAEKILATLARPFHFGNIAHIGTASIGATLIKGDGVSPEALLKQADLALYRSKDAGRGVSRFFDAQMEATVHERATLERELRQAVEEGQFLLHFQPQIGIADELGGAEALIRWEHPRRGLVPLDAFIPLAEETGLILPMGRWVLETACRQLACWASLPELAHCDIAVNVSALQFRQSDFVAQVEAILRATGADPRRLTLEITESLLLQNVDEIVAKMTALKRIGVSFALDDFGTGYSSMVFLKRLPLDRLKIDRSFVRDVLSDANDAVIVRMMISLGQTLGLEVIAEGVETAEQRAFLVRAGCSAGQGYFFGRPLPADGFEQFARQRRAARPPRAPRDGSLDRDCGHDAGPRRAIGAL